MNNSTKLPFQGIPIVISGPSGVGKGTIISRASEMNPHLVYSISMTTRPPRPAEQDGKHYHFVSQERFMTGIENREFVEWAQVYDHYYGTPRMPLEQHMAKGNDVILEVDVQGAASAKSLYPQSVLIYVIPPSLEDLNLRLYGREQSIGDNLDKRFSEAVRELRYVDLFDYVILNDDLNKAVKELNALLIACRLTRERMKPLLTKQGLFKETL